MATRFINQGIGVPEGVGHCAGFAIDTDGTLKINRGIDAKGSLSADPGSEPISVNRVVAVTATTHTVSAADCGAYIACATTNTVTVNLPKCSTVGAGFEVTIGVAALTGSGGHKAKPNAADTIVFTGAAASSSVECSAATDVLGDCLTLRSDGASSGKWYITSKVGTWAAIA